MNNLNSFLIDARAAIAIAVAERKKEVKTSTSSVGEADAGIMATGVALRVIDRGVIIFGLKGTKLLKRRDF